MGWLRATFRETQRNPKPNQHHIIAMTIAMETATMVTRVGEATVATDVQEPQTAGQEGEKATIVAIVPGIAVTRGVKTTTTELIAGAIVGQIHKEAPSLTTNMDRHELVAVILVAERATAIAPPATVTALPVTVTALPVTDGHHTTNLANHSRTHMTSAPETIETTMASFSTSWPS